MADELWRRSAGELARLIASREVSSREVVLAHLDRIADAGPKVNAVTVVLADTALDAAARADEATARGATLGPLHGVPFTVKENIDLVGSATTQGVPALAGAMPAVDAPGPERMKAAGAIPIGRTNLPDMGLRVHTDSGLRGLTRNPWHPGLTAGGSSGGEASALATGQTPIGLGNDIGGSLRNPAYCCGIASLKPGLGRIPHATCIPPEHGTLSAQLMAVQGPMARRVDDLRLALSVLAGPHPRDPWSMPAPLVGPPVARRVALVPHPEGGTTAPQVSAAVRAAGHALAAAGYTVDEVQPPAVAACTALWGRWLGAELAAIRPQFAPAMSEAANTFLDHALTMWGPLSFEEHLAALVERHALASAWSGFLATYPVIVGPVWTQPPFPHGYDISSPAAAAEVLTERLRFVVPFNLLGLPVVVVPTGTHDGLPVGVQVAADRMREDVALDAAAVIEAALGTITPIDPVTVAANV